MCGSSIDLRLPTMLSFMVNKIHEFVDATSIVAGRKQVELKFSPEMFTMRANGSPSSSSCSIIALQLFPQFFQQYFCYKLQYSWTYTGFFYPILLHLHLNHFSSLTFSSQDPHHHADLTFETRQGPLCHSRKVELSLSPSINELMDVGEFDFGTFVSIDSQELINIVRELKNPDVALVILTESQVKFSYNKTNIILTQQRRQCIIGGVEPRDQLHFVIPLPPMITLCNLARQSKRVWLFKFKNYSRGVIYAPLGLHARVLVYFPNGCLREKA